MGGCVGRWGFESMEHFPAARVHNLALCRPATGGRGLSGLRPPVRRRIPFARYAKITVSFRDHHAKKGGCPTRANRRATTKHIARLIAPAGRERPHPAVPAHRSVPPRCAPLSPGISPGVWDWEGRGRGHHRAGADAPVARAGGEGTVPRAGAVHSHADAEHCRGVRGSATPDRCDRPLGGHNSSTGRDACEPDRWENRLAPPR